MMTDRRSEVESSIIAFRATKDLVAATEAAAVSEGTGRMKSLNIKDTTTAAKPGRRSTSHLRRR